MTTDEMTKLLDTLNEAFRQMGATIKELANSIREFFESLTSANERVYRLPDKYFTRLKRNIEIATLAICIKSNANFKGISPTSDEFINRYRMGQFKKRRATYELCL